MKLNIKSGLKVAGLYFKDHAPEYLTGIGIAGFITTTVLAVRATPKAVDELRKKKPKTVVEEIKIAGKYYVVAIVTGTLSTICLVSSCSVSKRRNAALAAALALSEDNLIEYKDKVKEMFGEKKEEKVQQEVDIDKAEKIPLCPHDVTYTGKGNTLCLDSITGQYFYSDINAIKTAFLDLNDMLDARDEIDLQDYTYELGIEEPRLISHILKWKKRSKDYRLELSAGSTLKDGIPVFVVGHKNPPRYD